jgi:flagellar biosynthesis chaperone FliJ
VKKFQFSYERLMDWRDRRAEQERLELQRLRQTGADLVQRRAELVSEMKSARSTLALGSALSGADLRQAAAFVTALQAQERAVQIQQTACAQAIEAQLQRCIEADRDYKLLGKVRDKRLAEWQVEYNKESEQAAEEAWQAGRTRAMSTGPGKT